MEKHPSYTHLRPEDRVVIAGMARLGASVRAMARTLERSPSTVSRELARNHSPDAGHASQAAARPPRKLNTHAVSWGVVRTLLDRQGSPQQIAATLKRVCPDQPAQHVSHETIYTAIYAQPRG
jgi:IS30 family transposase